MSRNGWLTFTFLFLDRFGRLGQTGTDTFVVLRRIPLVVVLFVFPFFGHFVVPKTSSDCSIKPRYCTTARLSKGEKQKHDSPRHTKWSLIIWKNSPDKSILNTVPKHDRFVLLTRYACSYHRRSAALSTTRDAKLATVSRLRYRSRLRKNRSIILSLLYTVPSSDCGSIPISESRFDNSVPEPFKCSKWR